MTAPFSKLRDALADRYRLESELGAGGMATVYLAQDLKHDRQVAIKVLHPELAAVIGADRFLAEIKVTASLQHPHILPLFDSGAVDSSLTTHDSRLLFYVMPFVEGESLRGRLTRERQLPVPDAVRIATEVASALDYAHRRGVIHRDIKPENILLHDGTALVADFGIALALTAAGGGRLTQTGLSLGTPAYMSPEQAMGEREIGARSDVYALGAITYEMLTGEAPFTGPTAQAIVARTLTEVPRPISPQRKSVPASVENAVLTALEKLPADRYATAAEFAQALGDADARPRTGRGSTVQMRSRALSGAPAGRLGWVLGGAAVLLGAAALAVALTHGGARNATASTAGPVRFRMPELGNIGYFSVAPDGRQILGISPDSSGVLHAWIRRLDDIQPARLPGTEGAERVWLSPDGTQVLIRTATALKVLSVSGGTPREIGQVRGYVTAEWGPQDSIVVTTGDHLLLVPASGGESRVIATIDSSDISFYIPRFLPGGRELLVGVRHATDSIGLYQMDLGTGKRVQVLPNVQEVRYYDPGRILWLSADGTVRYAAYDMRRHAVGAQQVILAEGMDDFFANGDLIVLRPGLPNANLRFFDARLGTTMDLAYPDTTVSVPAFSRDGTRLAMALTPIGNLRTVERADQAPGTDLWVLDRATGLKRRVAEHAFAAAWSPDATSLAFMRSRSGGGTELWVVPAIGGAPVKIEGKPSQKFGLDFTPDGQGLIYTDAPSGQITLQPLAGNAIATPLFDDDAGDDVDAVFSPDGKWLLYQSFDRASGRAIVRAWPDLDRRTVIMPAGNCGAHWGDGGKRIYGCSPDGAVVWIDFDPATGRSIGNPQVVSQVPQREPDFDVNPRGLDLAWVSAPPRFGTEPLVLAHWLADAERRLQAAKR